MSTQQDIYAASFEIRPLMLNKENYVPWSSRLLWYAKSRPNGKLIHNSILNGPYVRRMIPEPGDVNCDVNVTETFHLQTNDELSGKELKQIEADDQAIRLFYLQMMKGSDIGIEEKNAKLFNEWERFTSNEGESIGSYYHRFLKLMNDLKRNKHFPEKIATDYTQLYDFLKYNQKEVDELKAERLAKTQDPLALMANSNNPYAFLATHQDLSSFNQNYLQQPIPKPEDITYPTIEMNMALVLMAKAFKLNYSTPTNNNQRILSNPRNRKIAQPCMNMGQDRQMQMVGSNGGNQFRQYAGQNVGNPAGYNDVIGNQNQIGNGNLVAARADGNAVGQNGNQIRCYNCRRVGHYARNCTVRPKRRDAAYLQTQLLIAQKEEAGIQLQAEEYDLMANAADLDKIEEVNANCILMANMQQASTLALPSMIQTDQLRPRRRDAAYLQTHLLIAQKEEAGIQLQAEEYDLMAAAVDLDEIKKVNANCILMANLQQASTSGTQTDSAPVYDTDGSAEVHENCDDNEIFNMFTQEEQYTELLEPILESYQVPQNDNDVTSEDTSVEQDGETVEQHPTNFEETRALYESVYQNLAIEVEKVNSVNRKLKETNADMTSELARYKNQERCFEINLSDDTTPSVARKFLNEVKSTIVTLQRVVKQRMTIETHNWASSDHQELHKIVRDENFPIVYQVDARLQNFKIQFLKEASKFVGDFKSLANEADASLTKHKALEWEIERLLKAVVSDQKDNTQDTSKNTKYAKQPIVENLPKIGETNALSKPVTSNSVSIPQESKGVNNDKVIAPGIFRINPDKTSREAKKVPNTVSTSARTKPITVSQPSVITKKDVNSDLNGLSSTGIDTTKSRRPQLRSNTKNDRVPSVSKSSQSQNKKVEVEENHRNLLLSKNNKHISSACNNIKIDSHDVISKVVCAMCKKCLISVNHDKCLSKYVNGKNSCGKNQKAKVSVKEIQKKYQPKDAKPKKVIQICLCCVDSGCSKHMTGNLKLLINFVWKFMGTVRFGNDHVAAILGFGDLQWGNILITRVYFIEGLGHNLFLIGLLKFKYHKEHLCPSCEQGKRKRASHPPKPVPNSKQRLHLLYMDLCGPIRIASINGKRHVLVMVDDYSRYTWVHFLRSKDEALEVIIKFLKRISVLLQSLIIIIRTDNGTEFKNQVLKEYFDFVGISHQMSSVRTPQQNVVVERRNRMLVEAARTMLIFLHAPLFLWAEAIATACFTQNRSIIHPRFNKTPYELINGRKPNISFHYAFGALCYPKNDREDIGKLGAKGDIGFFIGYSSDSCAYRVYNRRTKKIMETMNVSFDELSAMAFEQRSSKPGLQSMTSGHISSGLDLTYAPSTITTQQPSEGELDLLFEAMYDDYSGGKPSATARTVPPAQEP
nr:integrase, catalytic region, zinc finger, CCHC-type, peptidase aspartic, catalytic [Tanacetum cinerariifolium]